MDQLIGTLNKVNAKVDKLEKEIRDVKRAGKQAGDSTHAGFTKGGEAVKGVAQGILGATTVMGLFTKSVQLAGAELDNLEQKRLKSGEAGLGIGTRRAIALANVPGHLIPLFDRIVKEAATRKTAPLGERCAR